MERPRAFEVAISFAPLTVSQRSFPISRNGNPFNVSTNSIALLVISSRGGRYRGNHRIAVPGPDLGCRLILEKIQIHIKLADD